MNIKFWKHFFFDQFTLYGGGGGGKGGGSKGGDILSVVVPVVEVAAVVVAAPIVGPAIVADMGVAASAATATAVGAAAIGGAEGAVNTAIAGGSPEDVIKAGVTSAATSAVSSTISAVAGDLAPDLTSTGAAVAGGAATGAATQAIRGGDVGAGAAGGALGSTLATDIGGTLGSTIGGAAGSATAAQLAGGDVAKSALLGGATGAAGGLAKDAITPTPDTTVAQIPQPTQLAQNQPTVTLGPLDQPQVTTDAPTGSFQATPLPEGVMFNPDLNQYTYADGTIYNPTLDTSTSQPAPNIIQAMVVSYDQPSNTAVVMDGSGGVKTVTTTGPVTPNSMVSVDTSTNSISTGTDSGGRSGAGTGSAKKDLSAGELTVPGRQDLSAGELTVSGKQSQTIGPDETDESKSTKKEDNVKLISPTIIASKRQATGTTGAADVGVSSTPVGTTPGSQALAQALNIGGGDIYPPIQYEQGKKRSVWNQASLRNPSEESGA